MNRKTNKRSQNKISTDQESNDQLGCQCQILNDTSLSNVSDSSCSCSQCLQANLNAFNQFKQQQQHQLRQARSLDKIKQKTKTNKQQSTLNNLRSKTRYGKNLNMSLNKGTNYHNNQINSQQNHIHNKQTQRLYNKFTQQNINDYILITQQRTRQYLTQKNKINQLNLKQQQQLKRKIKQNLQILKYTVQNLQPKLKLQDQQHKQNIHKYKWNHTPAISREIKEIRKKKTQCKIKLKQRKNQRTKVDTNLENIIPQFSNNPSQFLQQVKIKRLQKFKQCHGCPYDHCPNHHMRTSQQRLQQIQNFIKNKVKQYNLQKKKQKLKAKQDQKVKQAKLRAIDIKCQQILKRSKKYDPSQSRTTFRLSIDHFSTFSDLRVNKKQKDEIKQQRKEMRKMMKQKGGNLQKAIYQDVFEQQHLSVQEKIKSKPNMKVEIQNMMKKEYCQKITKDAKIRSPRNIKADDQKYMKQKEQKHKNKMNPKEQKKKAKQITLQIQRKKMQLMEQYKRQKELKQSKNQKLKNQHKESLVQSRR